MGYRLAQPPGEVGFVNCTRASSPGCERDTLRCECDSQTNISTKFKPMSFTGARTTISFNFSILTFSTPTAKKGVSEAPVLELDAAVSAACGDWATQTRSGARLQLTLGARGACVPCA